MTKAVRLKSLFTAALLVGVSTHGFADTANEYVVRSINNSAAFDRTFYATMQAVIDSRPTTELFDPVTGELSSRYINTHCDIGENGDAYCRTSYEKYDYRDKLIAIFDFHSSGRIERSLIAGGLPRLTDLKTGKTSGGSNLILVEDGMLLTYNEDGSTKEIREHF